LARVPTLDEGDCLPCDNLRPARIDHRFDFSWSAGAETCSASSSTTMKKSLYFTFARNARSPSRAGYRPCAIGDQGALLDYRSRSIGYRRPKTTKRAAVLLKASGGHLSVPPRAARSARIWRRSGSRCSGAAPAPWPRHGARRHHRPPQPQDDTSAIDRQPPSPIAHIHLKAALLLCCLNFRPKTSIAYSMRAC
jgi:hypothetical protein